MSERSEAMEQNAVSNAAPGYRAVPADAAMDDVPPGYKRTEVGVISKDWKIKTFGDVLSKENVKSFQVQTSDYRSFGKYPVVDQGKQKIVGFTDREDKIFPCPKGGVIVFGDHTCVIKYIDFDFSVGADGTQVLKAKTTESTKYFAYQLDHRGVEPTGYNRHFKFLKERVFIVPPLHEQRAIAAALSDADALLESLNRLIAKKRTIKQAAMQQLLTGQTRLPGFTGQWETKRLGAIASFHKGSGISKSELLTDGTNSCIHYGELFTQYGERIADVKSRTNHQSGCFKSLPNDVLMPTSDVTPNGLATASCITRRDVILGGDILVIRCSDSEMDGTFLAYKIRMDHRQIMQLVSGTTVFHIYSRDMAEFLYSAPTIDEQRAVVSVLTEMDAEIKALECRRDKARQIKQGMMQQLLSGRVRLVEPGEAV